MMSVVRGLRPQPAHGQLQQHQQLSHLRTSTDTASFDAVEDWINDVKTERGGDVLILMVGNKVDLASARVVSVEAGQEAAQRLGAMFMECSARTGQGIKDMFRDIAETLPSRNTAATPAPCTYTLAPQVLAAPHVSPPARPPALLHTHPAQYQMSSWQPIASPTKSHSQAQAVAAGDASAFHRPFLAHIHIHATTLQPAWHIRAQLMWVYV